MFYGLATMEEEFLADNLFTFAAIDPCTIDVSEGDALYEEGLFHFDEYGIYVFGGPNWSEDRKTICDNFSQEVCDYADSTSDLVGTGVPHSLLDPQDKFKHATCLTTKVVTCSHASAQPLRIISANGQSQPRRWL